MNAQDRINQFLTDAKDLTIGYNALNFYEPDEVAEHQEAYREFISSGYEVPEGVVCDNFMVIGTDELGDPIFVDLATEELVVSCAGEDEEGVAIAQLADTLAGFREILARLAELGHGRDTPDLMETNPVPEAEASAFLQWFEEKNPGSDGWYWELFLENDEVEPME